MPHDEHQFQRHEFDNPVLGDIPPQYENLMHQLALLTCLTWTATVELGLPARSCVIAVRLLIEAAKRLGLHAQPLGVALMVANPAAGVGILAGMPPGLWPASATTCILDEDNTAGDPASLAGHMVAHITVFGRTWLLDPTSPQVNQPDDGITLPPLVTLLDEGVHLTSSYGFTLRPHGGELVGYRLLAGDRWRDAYQNTDSLQKLLDAAVPKIVDSVHHSIEERRRDSSLSTGR